jgi:hypothetical protein
MATTDHAEQSADVTEYELDHNVTSRNTVKHWTLYTLSGLEADNQDDDENPVREDGALPAELFAFAAGEDSIIFTSEYEVSGALSDMARDGSPWEDESRAVNRRSNGTTWDGADVQYRYRLNDWGRRVLMELGVPSKLPNRPDMDEGERELSVKPAHDPTWWQSEYELYSEAWNPADNDWDATSHDRVFVKESAGIAETRGYTSMVGDIADAFPGVTFVVTCGPYRPHDLAYAIRDPWNKVVQIDVYSALAVSRSAERQEKSVKNLVGDLHDALESV